MPFKIPVFIFFLAIPVLVTSAIAQVNPTPITSAVVIESKALREITVQPEREALATVVSRNESKLSAEVAGTIQRWTVDLGATVKKGDILVVLDPTDAQLAVQRAQATVDAVNARANLVEIQTKRARDLREQGFISPDALLQRETELQVIKTDQASARSAYATAQRALSKTTIRAPFAGIVKQRGAQLGESVGPGALLYILIEGTAPEVSASVLPNEVAGLRKSSQITFNAQGQSVAVKLARVAATVSPTSRTQEVRFSLPAEADLTVGAEGQLRWKDASNNIPGQYVVKRGTALGVFVDQGSRAKFIALANAQEGRSTPTTLPADTKLIVRGQASLQDGQALK